MEQGRELVRANTKSGYGNFHLKPNGVFYVAGDMAGVLETSAYLKRRPAIDLATQSGPMLVINGRLHPKFDRASSSLKTRNGVGIRAPNAIVFAISEGEVSFDAFARLFRDRLHCNDALFLDGGSAATSMCRPCGKAAICCRWDRCWVSSRRRTPGVNWLHVQSAGLSATSLAGHRLGRRGAPASERRPRALTNPVCSYWPGSFSARVRNERGARLSAAQRWP